MSYSSETRFNSSYSFPQAEAIPGSFQDSARNTNNNQGNTTVQTSITPTFNPPIPPPVTQGQSQSINTMELLLSAYPLEQRSTDVII